MTYETEQKILAAALKVFAARGYSASTTKSIAKESGLSEFTLFRKFKTKENLFNMVLIQNIEKITKELESVFTNNEFESPGDFLEVFIKNLASLYDENFEAISIFQNENSNMLEPVMNEYINTLTDYIKKHIKTDRIDPQTLVLTITAFIYLLNTEKYHGRSFINYEDALEKFIKTMVQLVKSK